MKKKYKVIAELLLIILIFSLFYKFMNLSYSFTYLANANFGYFIIAIVIAFGTRFVNASRFYLLAGSIGVHLGYKKNLMVHFLTGFLGRFTPARVGEGSKVMLLEGDKQKIGFLFILEKIVDLITLVIISVIAIFTFSMYGSIGIKLMIFLGFFTIALVLLFHIEKIINLVMKRAVLEKQWFYKNLKSIPKKAFVIFLFNSLAIRFLVLSIPFLVAIALDIRISYWLIFQMYAVSIIAGWLSGLPGGMGTREVAYSFLLMAYSITKELAGIAAILVILVDLLVESVLAIAGYLALKVGRKSLPLNN